MALENVNQVDAIGIDKHSGHVVLSIIDDVDWQDELTHLILMQDKINNYLKFIESGSLYKAYPEAKGRNIDLKVFSKNQLSNKEEEFFAEASKIILQAGYKLTHKIIG